jgi:hypothetical protein
MTSLRQRSTPSQKQCRAGSERSSEIALTAGFYRYQDSEGLGIFGAKGC